MLLDWAAWDLEGTLLLEVWGLAWKLAPSLLSPNP